MSLEPSFQTLQYETEAPDAGAAAVAQVSGVMAGVFALGGVLDALTVAGSFARRGPINFVMGRRPLDLIDLVIWSTGIAAAVLVGARLLRQRPYRWPLLAGSVVLVGSRCFTLGLLLWQYLGRSGLPTKTLAYILSEQSTTTFILLMLPLANLVWFTRPAVKRYHLTLSQRWQRR